MLINPQWTYFFLISLQTASLLLPVTVLSFLFHQFLSNLRLHLTHHHSPGPKLNKFIIQNISNKMSSQNQGRQSPDPERQSGAQKDPPSSGQGVNDSSNNKADSKSQLEVRHWAPSSFSHTYIRTRHDNGQKLIINDQHFITGSLLQPQGPA
jgi:hypothetical protein